MGESTFAGSGPDGLAHHHQPHHGQHLRQRGQGQSTSTWLRSHRHVDVWYTAASLTIYAAVRIHPL